MNLLRYLSVLVAIFFAISFIICLVIQQIAAYSNIIEKARKFANNNF